MQENILLLKHKKLKPFERTEVKRLRSVEAAARKVSMVVAGPEVLSEADRKPTPTVMALRKVQFGRAAYADPSQVGTKQVHVGPVQDGPVHDGQNMVRRTGSKL